MVKTVPDELKSFAKAEVSFFLEKIPGVLKQGSSQHSFTQFIKLFSLYTDGVFSMNEFFSLIEDIRAPEPNP